MAHARRMFVHMSVCMSIYMPMCMSTRVYTDVYTLCSQEAWSEWFLLEYFAKTAGSEKVTLAIVADLDGREQVNVCSHVRRHVCRPAPWYDGTVWKGSRRDPF